MVIDQAPLATGHLSNIIIVGLFFYHCFLRIFVCALFVVPHQIKMISEIMSRHSAKFMIMQNYFKS